MCFVTSRLYLITRAAVSGPLTHFAAMKYLLPFLIPLVAFGQPKFKVDSVALIGNVLYQSINGITTQRGSVIFPASITGGLRYDSIWGSYYSQGATTIDHPGQFNVGIGTDVFANATPGQAKYDIHIGQRAGWKTTTGRNNIYIGWEAGRETGGATDNVGISEDALRDNQSGGQNVAIGRGAMISNLTGNLNVASGYNALQAQTKGNENVGIGPYALAWLVNGSDNIGIGAYAGEANGSDNVTINNSIYIGNQSGLSARFSNDICIGLNTDCVGPNKINIGNTILGDIATGDVSMKSVTVGGHTITADDNNLYVTTSTGVKTIPLQTLATVLARPQAFMVYNLAGQPLNQIVVLKPIER